MIRCSRLAAGALALSFLGCTGDADSSAAGGTVGLDAPDRFVDLAPEPVYTVGGFDAPEWAAFGSVNSLRFDAEGNLYVLDSQAKRIAVVGPDGELLRTVGKAGEGPGELNGPVGLAVTPEGRVATFDFSQRGFTLYGEDGTYMHTVPVDLQEMGFPGSNFWYHPSGGLVSAIGGVFRMSRNGEVETGPPTRPVAYFPLEKDAEGRVVYRAWDLPATDETSAQVGGSGGQLRIAMPRERAFEPGLYADVLPDGRIALVDSIGYRIKLVNLDGEVVETLERPVQATVVTEDIEEQERARRLAELEEGGGPRISIVTRGPGGSGGEVDQETVREMMRQRLDGMAFAQAIPVIESMRVDWDGRIWVQRSSGVPGEPGPTDIITAGGGYLGSLPADGFRIPSAFGPDGLVARIERDEYDVPTIIVERLPEDLRGAT